MREATRNYTYILKCGDGSLYTGWTNDIAARLEQHRSGKGAKYTRGRGPLQLVYLEVHDTKSEAMSREARIKRFTKTGSTVIYCNETIETYLHLQALNKSNVQLSIEDFGGKPLVSFLGVPIKCVDQLKNDEAKV